MSDQPNAIVRRGPAQLRGVARNVQYRSEARSENGAIQVLTLRLEQPGLSPVQVELRALALEGQVVEGEEVTVSGRWRRGRLVAREILSQSTGVAVRGRKAPLWLVLPVVIAFLAMFGLVLYFVIVGITGSGR
ncbi:hypothetical protein ACQHIV_27265 [Kribbella sp. GL6]|uniref:hypothetical protein n=1 Tax=Kribbella sp. GL6 TaxID=3419765 RepID=UPI003D052142